MDPGCTSCVGLSSCWGGGRDRAKEGVELEKLLPRSSKPPEQPAAAPGGQQQQLRPAQICCGVCVLLLLALIITIAICSQTSFPSNVSPDFIQHRLNGNPVFGPWSLANQQSTALLQELRSQLKPSGIAAKDDDAVSYWGAGANNLTWSEGPAAKVADMLYQATKVRGVWEKVPPKLRGVFWMKGNGVPEELATLQLSSWFDEEQILIGSVSPFSWAWAAGRPTNAPYGGTLYQQPWQRLMSAGLALDGMPGMAASTAFSACPKGSACEEGSTGLTYGNMQVHPHGDLKSITSFIPYVTSKYTMEEIPGSPLPGSHWKRGIWWGFGNCRCIPFGGYDLLKIIDGDGQAVEPFYSEFMGYIADVPLFVWSGFNTTAVP